MKKQPKKKETVLSVLQEMRDILKKAYLPQPTVAELLGTQDNKFLYTVTFPQKTAKEILGDNKMPNGNPVLYNTEWYKNENFFTKEFPRKGSVTVNLELLHKGKSWDECTKIAKDEGQEMLNFAEVVYLLKTSEQFWKLFENYQYTWVSSRSSFGGLVSLGNAASGGVRVGRGFPGNSFSDLGVCFSRSESLKPGN